MTKDFDIHFPDPIDGEPREAVWRSKDGIVHRAVGAWVHRNIRLMWTACGKHDIPANAAWLRIGWKEDDVDCPGCLQAEKVWDEETREERAAKGKFGAGA